MSESPRSRKILEEKLDFLRVEEAKAVDASHKFALKKQIEEVEQALAGLSTGRDPVSSDIPVRDPAGQVARVAGDSNQTILAQGDVHIGDQYVLSGPPPVDAGVEDVRHVPPPTPRFDDEETRRLSEELGDLYQRKEDLTIVGKDVRDVDAKIRGVKRRLRQGPQLRAGEFLDDGRYRLVEQIGRGGFATVWKAYDRRLQHLVAVKMLHGHYVEDKTTRDRFFRGARTMAKLQHPHVVRVLEPEVEDEGWCFFVMELVDGPNFEQAVLGGRLTTEQKLRIVIQVGEALELAHGRGIVHRDVKPSNILLDGDIRPKLTDFDLVRAEDTIGMTATQSGFGTVQFAAPEALMSAKEAGPSADVYSLASTLIFALRGKKLPGSYYRRPQATIKALACSEELKNVLTQAVSPNRRRRLQSIGVFIEQIRSSIRVSRPAGKSSESTKHSRRAGILISILAVVVLALVSVYIVDILLPGQRQDASPVALASGAAEGSHEIGLEPAEPPGEEPSERDLSIGQEDKQTPPESQDDVQVKKPSEPEGEAPSGQDFSEDPEAISSPPEDQRGTQSHSPAVGELIKKELVPRPSVGGEHSQPQEEWEDRQQDNKRVKRLEIDPQSEIKEQRSSVSLQKVGLSDLRDPGLFSAGRGDAVVNDVGVPLKLITTHATKFYARPDRNSASAPIDLFRYWYILPRIYGAESHRQSDLDSLTKGGFYRVASGLSERDFKGWLSAADVVVWRHRQALRPAADRRDRELVTFYASRGDAIAAVRSGDTSSATHREPFASTGLLLMPSLDVEDVRVDGKPNRVYQVAFVSGVRAQSTVDIVFVIDTMSGMTNPIEQIRASIVRVTRNLSRRPEVKRRLRLGLVGYRDTIDGVDPGPMEYVTKVMCNLEDGADHELFLKRLAALEVSRAQNDDYPDDALAGIATALDKDRLGWNPYAYRSVVVVSDSSAKTPEHPDPTSRKNYQGRTVQEIVDLASRTQGNLGVVISAIRIKDPLFPEDHAIGDVQFNRLVAGISYNGYIVSKRGGFDPEDFSEELTTQVLDLLANHEDLILGTGVRRSPAGRVTAGDYPPVLDLLQRLPDESTGEGDRVAVRYCTELDADGNRGLIPHLFIRRERLQAFASYLDFLVGFLEDSGDPGSRDVVALVSQLKLMTASSLQLDEPLNADMAVEQVLTAILGLRIKTRIFQLTFGELAAMSDTRFQEWVRSVDAVQEVLKSVVENEKLWFKLHPKAPDRDAHAFVALSDLP